jgi:hypothetical protein
VLGGIRVVARPRPGWLIVSLGLSLSGLVAGEFEPIARFMDWLEVRLRSLARGPRRLGEIAHHGESPGRPDDLALLCRAGLRDLLSVLRRLE